MMVMGLDTTGPDCSVAIIRDRAIQSHISEHIGRGHAEKLGPMVLEALADADLQPSEIDRVAVCTGPGSFTGLRVALSFAKGFALARRTPVLGFDRMTVALADAPDAVILQDIKRGETAFAIQGQTPLILSHDEASERATAHDGPILRDPRLNMETLCRLGGDARPEDHPPVAFYGRKPDAKLPGGLTPP